MKELCKFKGCKKEFYAKSLWCLNSGQVSFCKKHYYEVNFSVGKGRGLQGGLGNTPQHSVVKQVNPAQNTTLSSLSKTERNHILFRIDNYLMRVPKDLSGCVITEGRYVVEVSVYEKRE